MQRAKNEVELEAALIQRKRESDRHEMVQNGYRNKNLHKTFDETIEDVGVLIKDFSFAFRRPRNDIRADRT